MKRIDEIAQELREVRLSRDDNKETAFFERYPQFGNQCYVDFDLKGRCNGSHILMMGEVTPLGGYYAWLSISEGGYLQMNGKDKGIDWLQKQLAWLNENVDSSGNPQINQQVPVPTPGLHPL